MKSKRLSVGGALVSMKVSQELKTVLDGLKLHKRMSYDEVIRALARKVDKKKLWREVLRDIE